MLRLTLAALLCLLAVCTTAQSPDCSSDQADVYFLLDSSDDVSSTVHLAMLSFVKSFVGSVNIGPQDLQIGLYTYAASPKIQLWMNTYTEKSTLLTAIDGVPRDAGPRYIYRVLDFASLYGYAPSRNARPDAPAVLVLFTTGPAATPSQLPQYGERLRNWNFTLIAIGIGNSINTTELEIIATKPSYVLTVGDLLKDGSIQGEFRTAFSAAVAERKGCSVEPSASTPTGPTVVGLPFKPYCKVSENFSEGDIRSVDIYCEVTGIFPEAECSFYRKTDGGNPVGIPTEPSYVHKLSRTNSLYKSSCEVTVPVKDLGEGTHTFHILVYPNVTGGQSMVNATAVNKNVTLSLPRASHSCPPSLMQDYLCGRPVKCNCSLEYAGRPRGKAMWFWKGTKPNTGPLMVTYDSMYPGFTHTCEGMSDLGRTFGSTLQVATETTCL